MTTSFPSNPLPDISKLNYVSTEPDLVEAVNKQIDENIDDRRQYFEDKITFHNNYLKQQKSQLQGLLTLTKTGLQFAAYAREIHEAEKNYSNSGLGTKDWKKEVDDIYTESDENRGEVLNSLKGNPLGQAAVIAGTNDIKLDKEDVVAFKDWAVKTLPSIADTFPLYYEGNTENSTLFASSTIEEFQAKRKTLFQLIRTEFQKKKVNKNLFKAYAREDLFKLGEQLEEEWLTRQSNIVIDAAQKAKGEQLINGIKTLGEPGQAVTSLKGWLRINSSTHENFADGRRQAMGFIIPAIKNKTLKREHLTDFIGDVETDWNGTKKKKAFRDHYPTEAAMILNALKEVETEDRKSAGEAKKNAVFEFDTNVLSKAQEEIKNIPPGQRAAYVAEVQKSFNDTIGSVFPGAKSESLNTWITNLEKTEEDSLKHAEHLVRTNQRLPDGWDNNIFSAEGLDKASEILEDSKKRLPDKHQSEYEGNIRAAIADHLTEDLKGGNRQSEDFRQIESHAFPAFYDKVRKLLDDRSAKTPLEAADKAWDLIFKDEKTRKDLFNKWDAQGYKRKSEYDESSPQALAETMKLISNDSKALYSKEIHPGELQDLQAGLDFYNTGQGFIPTRYRNIAKATTEKDTGHELLVRRLKSTGFIDKEGKPIPERERLIPELQKLLLNRPSPSNTYRTILESEDPEWMLGLLKSIHPNIFIDNIDDLKTYLRLSNSFNNSLSSGANNLNTYYEIGEDDLKEWGDFTKRWGVVDPEVYPYMDITTMPPGLAFMFTSEKILESETKEDEQGVHQNDPGPKPRKEDFPIQPGDVIEPTNFGYYTGALSIDNLKYNTEAYNKAMFDWNEKNRTYRPLTRKVNNRTLVYNRQTDRYEREDGLYLKQERKEQKDALIQKSINERLEKAKALPDSKEVSTHRMPDGRYVQGPITVYKHVDEKGYVEYRLEPPTGGSI